MSLDNGVCVMPSVASKKIKILKVQLEIHRF